jgi:MFS family permease
LAELVVPADQARAAPRLPFRAGGLISLSIYWFGISFVWTPLLSIVLPVMVNAVVPATQKNTYLALLETVGLIIAALWQPLMGSLSDGVHTRWGRRRPFIVVGACGSALCFAFLAVTHGFIWILVGYAALQFFMNTAHGPYQSYIPDLVPEKQRGSASGYMGMATMVGTGLGSIVCGVLLSKGMIPQALLLMAANILVAMIITISRVREPHPKAVPKTAPLLSRAFTALIPDFRTYHDFAWLLASRFAILAGLAAISRFALNYMRDTFTSYQLGPVNLHGPALATAALLMVLLVFAAISTVPASALSDRVGRKPMVAFSGLCGLAGALLLMWAKDPVHALIFAIPLGVCFGVFTGVDWAYAADLIPKAESGKYMGISNFATAGSQAAAAAAIGPLIDLGNAHQSGFGYTIMFLSSAVLFTAGTLLLRKVQATSVE